MKGSIVMACNIMVVKIGARRDKSPKVQEVLSKFGCSIKVRLGLHETENVCSDEGILVLQLTGDRDEMLKLEKALNGMESIKAKIVMLDD
ncbi:MAG: hypothetical protein R2876_04215 [Eubacteriales bacterium]